jgi:hypothetical protein
LINYLFGLEEAAALAVSFAYIHSKFLGAEKITARDLRGSRAHIGTIGDEIEKFVSDN